MNNSSDSNTTLPLVVVVSPEYIIAGIFTILTNLALLIFIISNRTLRRSKHAIVASSLVAGILFASIYIIPRFAILNNNGKESFPRDFRCGIISRIGQALFLSLNLHLITHVSEFYIQVVYPLNAQEWLKKKNIIIVLAIIWSITLLPPISMQLYFETLAISKGAFKETDCVSTYVTFLIILSIILAVISIIILIISSFAYAHVLKITHNAIKETQKVLHHLSNNYNDCSFKTADEKKKLSHLKLRIKSIVQAIIVYVFYLLSLMPFLILIIYSQFTYTLPDQQLPTALSSALRYLQYIAFLFPAIQPILFFFFTAEFRNQLDVYRKRTTSLTLSIKKPVTTLVPTI